MNSIKALNSASGASKNTGAESPKDILIVGGDAVAWTAAYALAKHFSAAGVKVSVLSSPDAGTRKKVITCLPETFFFHGSLGLYEKEFMAKSGATFRLADGYQFLNNKFYLAQEGLGEGAYGVALHQLYIIAAKHADALPERAAGLLPADHYSFASSVCREAKFSHPNTNNAQINKSLDYGYHIDAQMYAALLKEKAIAAGVSIIEKTLTDVERDNDGAVKRLLLDDGVIAADLYINTECNILSDAAKNNYVALGSYGYEEHLNEPVDIAIPASHYKYSSNQLVQNLSSAVSANRRHFAFLDNETQALSSTIDIGFTPTPWDKNVVSLGRAAANLGDLAVSTEDLAQSSISRFISLFPRGDTNTELAIEFNRLSEQEFKNVWEFHEAQLWASRLNNLNSDECNNMSDNLSRRVKLFQSCGCVPTSAHDFIGQNVWNAFLLFCGIMPKNKNAIGKAIPLNEIKRVLEHRYKTNTMIIPKMYDNTVYLKEFTKNN